MRCDLVNSSSSRSSSDVKKFSLLREFSQQPGTASSRRTLGTCVRVSQGRVGCRKGAGLYGGSALSPPAAPALVLATLQLLLPLQGCEPLSGSTQPCPKPTPHSCRARHLARCPSHPYSQGTGRRGTGTLSGVRHGVGTATSSSCWDFSLTRS